MKELSDILSTIKGNVKKTSSTLKVWEDNKLFARKDKPLAKTDLEDFVREHIDARCSKIEEGSNEIHALLSNSNRTLKVSKGAAAWKSYVDYVGNVVVDGISSCILATLRQMAEELDTRAMAKNNRAPMLEVEIRLLDPPAGSDEGARVAWVPEIGSAPDGSGIRDMFTGWLRRIVNVANLMKRLDIGEGTYAAELEDDYVVADAITRLQAS